jgi:glycosyltransferase involved in cell wall biosynthesis
MLIAGFTPILIGRELKSSSDIKRPYPVIRMKLWATSGALFYAMFNLRLFFLLMSKRCSVIWANDLDTLLACFVASKLKGVPLIFDSHEYFTEVPEIQHKPLVKKTWQTIERFIVPHVHQCITVSQSIADLFFKKYGKVFHVVRNIPVFDPFSGETVKPSSELFPENELLLILQGSGINIDRGAEELLEAIKQTTFINLLIIGGGDVINQLKEFVDRNNLSKRVSFVPKMDYHKMMQYTRSADVGVTLDKSTNVNYLYSLPNKLFDYIHAGIPVLASPLVEVGQIITDNNLGWVLPEHSVEAMVNCLNYLKNNKKEIEAKAQNCESIKSTFDWNDEALVITDILYQIE